MNVATVLDSSSPVSMILRLRKGASPHEVQRHLRELGAGDDHVRALLVVHRRSYGAYKGSCGSARAGIIHAKNATPDTLFFTVPRPVL